MKVPDSGMPEQSYWESLFDLPLIAGWLELATVDKPVVEIGCGYGTFTIPVAKSIKSMLYAFDVEPSMIETAERNVRSAGLHNVRFSHRDIIESGTGLEEGSVGLVLLFNILHSEHRRTFLEEASRILAQSGRVAIIHWRKDIETPRGPRTELRPDLQTILDASTGLGLSYQGKSGILKPYHWGIQLTKGSGNEDRDHPGNQ